MKHLMWPNVSSENSYSNSALLIHNNPSLHLFTLIIIQPCFYPISEVSSSGSPAQDRYFLTSGPSWCIWTTPGQIRASELMWPGWIISDPLYCIWTGLIWLYWWAALCCVHPAELAEHKQKNDFSCQNGEMRSSAAVTKWHFCVSVRSRWAQFKNIN